MKRVTCAIWFSSALALAAFCPLWADDVAVYASDAMTASLDTTGEPYAITNALQSVSLPYFLGESITATPSGGAAVSLVASAAAAGSYDWSPLSGGVWTLVNPDEGVATFTVRYSIFGTQGEGTEVDPVRIMDGDELSDLYAAGTVPAGSYFLLCGLDGLLDRLSIPEGVSLSFDANGVGRLAASASGEVYSSASCASAIDTDIKSSGTKVVRKVRNDRWIVPLAYSGDGWLGNPTAASSVTVTSPQGVSTVLDFVGTGTYQFPSGTFSSGNWTLQLDADGMDTLYATLSIYDGLMLIVF